MTAGPRRVLAGGTALAAVLAAGAGLATAAGDLAPRATGVTPAALPDFPPLRPDPGGGALRAERNAAARRGRLTAHLLRPAILRDAPDGGRVARVGRRTGYGARRVFAAAAFAPGWVGVRALQRPNDELAWLPEEAVRVAPIRTTLVADLSDRELTVRVDGKVRHRAPVGIGRPDSTTPVGRFGVTDRLRGGPGAAVYGCCVLPLTGRQPNPPPGWTGGTRLALHGTPSADSVGQEVSAGCLRMRDADLKRLMASVPLGATLVVRR